MRKPSAVILICAMFVLSLFPAIDAPRPVLAEKADVYEVDWNQFNAGDKIGNAPKQGLVQSGGADITVVDNNGTKSFYLAGRKDNWDSLDLQNAYLNLDRTASYEITVTGHVDTGVNTKGANVKLGGVSKKSGGDDGYPEFNKVKLEAGKSFTLTYTLRISEVIADAARTLSTIRVQTDESSGLAAGDLVPFYVDSIAIAQKEVASVPPATPSPAGSVTLYELDADGSLIPGSPFATPALKKSGDANISVVEGEDGTKALAVTDRVNNYDGVDILRDTLKINDLFRAGTYQFTVKGHVAPGDAASSVQLVLGMTESPWSELSRVSLLSDGSFEITYSKEYANAADLATLGYNFRIQTPPAVLTSFYIDNVVVTAQVSNAPEATPLLAFPFDDKAAQESLFTVGASSAITWMSESGIGKDSDTALKVVHLADKNYNSADNAVRLSLAEPLPAGGVYQISAWFYAPAEGNQGKSTLTGPGVVLNADYAGATGTSKFPSNYGTLPLGEWKELKVTLPLQEKPLDSIDFRLVENAADKFADVWYLDNITIGRIGELTQIIVPQWDLTLGSIAQAYKGSFLIGNVMEPDQTADADMTAMFKHHYNVVTPENAMKPVNMTSAKGVYNFAKADKIVNWAEANGIPVHGHTLVWHSQSAPWLNTGSDGKPLTRAEAKANLEAYINNVAGHYKGKVISWDVVNEAFRTGVSAVPANWRDALRKDQAAPEGSMWYQAYENGADKSKGESGEDYIYDAFVLARLADPGATLYYNDFNETETGKREAIASMVEELNTKWKSDARNTQSGRLLIEGIGMQAHYWTSDLRVSDVEAAIERFIKTGAEISASEVDIPHGNSSNYKSRTTAPTKEEELLQADLYKQVFEVYKKYERYIKRVTFWGKADSQSWRSEGYPSLFDKAYAPKAAYLAVMDVAKDGDSPDPSNPSGPSTAEEKDSGITVTDAGVDLSVPAVVETQDGIRTAVVSIEADQLRKAFESLPRAANGQISIKVDSDAPTAVVTFPADALAAGAQAAPDSVLSITSGNIRYDLPVQVIPAAALAQSLGTDAAHMTIRLVITKTSGPVADLAAAAAKAAGATLVSDAIEFTITAEGGGKKLGVNDFGQTYVSRTIVLPSTEDFTGYAAVMIDPETGALSFVPALFASVNGSLEATIKRPGNSLYAIVESSRTFDDLQGHWAQADIELLASKFLVNGRNATAFAPNSRITRAEFAALLVRALGLHEDAAAAKFSDVQASSDWFAGQVGAAFQAGLVEGCDNGEFRPNKTITREQMALMLARAIAFAGGQADADTKKLAAFTDIGSLSSWAADAVAGMVNAGIMSGVTDTFLVPGGDATRAESAVMLKRFLQYVNFMN